MKKRVLNTISICFVAIFFTSIVNAQIDATNNQTNSINKPFELVESVPAATIYGQPGVRHPQQVWLDMIKSANKTIDLGAFYMATQPHEAMQPIIDALKAAAENGVKIRIILDKSFMRNSTEAVNELQHIPNIQLRTIPMNLITGGIMHAKYMVVDGIDSFVGSQNFDWRALTQIHEIGVRIINKRLAQTITHVFDLDWQLCKTHNITMHQKLLYASTNFAPVTANRPIIVKDNGENLVIHAAYSPHSLLPQGYNWEQTQFIQALNNARHQVLMQVLTYSPDAGYGRKGYWPALDNAIRAAAGRGVKVKLIVSNWAQRYPMINYLKSLSLVPNVKIKISTIPMYNNEFIPHARVEHCKYFVIDNDLSWIGTGNWQWSYFHDTRNIAIIIYGKSPNQQLRDIFFRDWNGPYTKFIDVNEKYTMPKTQ